MILYIFITITTAAPPPPPNFVCVTNPVVNVYCFCENIGIKKEKDVVQQRWRPDEGHTYLKSLNC